LPAVRSELPNLVSQRSASQGGSTDPCQGNITR
jgi:hypothetical protein